MGEDRKQRGDQSCRRIECLKIMKGKNYDGVYTAGGLGIIQAQFFKIPGMNIVKVTRCFGNLFKYLRDTMQEQSWLLRDQSGRNCDRFDYCRASC